MTSRDCLACGAPTVIARTYPRGTTSDRQRVYVEWEDLPVASCTTCGYSWVTAVPDNLDEYYRKVYSQDLGRNKKAPPAEYFADEANLYRPERSWRHIELMVRHTPRLERVLDVGPGLGVTLSLLPEGVDRLAVEPDEVMWPYLEHVGAKIVARDDIRPGTIDAVISSHQLEHLPPDELPDFLEWIRSVIRPGGTFVAEVPHASLLRIEVGHVRHDPHLSFFSIEALDKMITRAGFDTVLVECGGTKPSPLIPVPLYRPAEDEPVYAALLGGPTVVARPVASTATVIRDQTAHAARKASHVLASNARRGARLGRRAGGRVKRRVAARRDEA